MNSRIKIYWLIALCYTATLLTGCFPEDGLEWSDDGSVGIFRIDDQLCLVDGQSGQLTSIQIDGQAGVMPDISADGKQIAYVRERTCAKVEEGLKLLSPVLVNRIKRDAKQLAEQIVGGYVFPQNLPMGESAKTSRNDSYHQWVVRMMAANPSDELAKRLGADKLAECRDCDLKINEVVVAERANPSQGKVLTTMPIPVFRPRFSPNGRHVAYLVTAPDDDKAWLAVAAVAGDTGPLEVAEAVGIGFDWRPDSKALGFVKQDGDEILAVVKETVIVGNEGTLQANTSDIDKDYGLYRLVATDSGQQFAGTLYSPTMHVQYGAGGRILFSSAAAQIPTSDLDEPNYSLFCYDRIMGTVTNILPGILQNQTSPTMSFFSLSPDGTRLLVSLPSNRFVIYTLGSNEVIFPLGENEGFGNNELPKFLPQWKGNDQITCLVSETSHFLVGQDGQSHRRKEIVVLDVEGQFQKVLSADWPDEAIPSTDD